MADERLARGPMKLRASLHETIWGGQRLADVAGKELAAGALVGESWETALDALVVEGPFVGQTLGEAVDALGGELIGARAVEVFGLRFPLLAKFIDAQQWLSVQTHPNDQYAAEHEYGKLGKTECWYILGAEPGAKIVYGVRHPVTPEDVRIAVNANRLEDLLYSVEVRPGDAVFVPAGTVHAIGAGVTLFELQEYSDVTYRLYDYGRIQPDGQPRELHLERALDVMRYEPSPNHAVTPVTLASDAHVTRRALVACDYFVEEELAIRDSVQGSVSESSLHILVALDGECVLETPDSDAMVIARGETVTLPAGLGSYTLSGVARLIRAYVPEADDEALALWRAAQASGVASV